MWGTSLGDWTLRVVQQIATAIVSALPGLTIVLIIFLITAFILKLLKMVLNQVEAGRLQLPGVHPETVGPPVSSFPLPSGYLLSPPHGRFFPVQTRWRLKVLAFSSA